MQIYVNTYGTSLRIKEGLLSIRVEDKIQRVPVGTISKLFVAPAIALSSDVLYTCIEYGIDLIITERNGQPIGRLWNNKFGSISTIRKKQLAYSKSPEVNDWVIGQIAEKVRQQIELLECFHSLHDCSTLYIQQSIVKMRELATKLAKYKGGEIAKTAQGIRAYEGQVAKVYFSCINEHLPDKYRFRTRSKHPARDMFNSMLNYAYGILYSHIDTALVKSGLDPYIGFFSPRRVQQASADLRCDRDSETLG